MHPYHYPYREEGRRREEEEPEMKKQKTMGNVIVNDAGAKPKSPLDSPNDMDDILKGFLNSETEENSKKK